jgi:hypothetical protein
MEKTEFPLEEWCEYGCTSCFRILYSLELSAVLSVGQHRSLWNSFRHELRSPSIFRHTAHRCAVSGDCPISIPLHRRVKLQQARGYRSTTPFTPRPPSPRLRPRVTPAPCTAPPSLHGRRPIAAPPIPRTARRTSRGLLPAPIRRGPARPAVTAPLPPPRRRRPRRDGNRDAGAAGTAPPQHRGRRPAGEGRGAAPLAHNPSPLPPP